MLRSIADRPSTWASLLAPDVLRLPEAAERRAQTEGQGPWPR